MPSMQSNGFQVESIAILDKVREKIQDIPLTKGKVLEDKLSQVLEKNSNLKIFVYMTKIHSGESAIMPSGWSPNDVSKLKYSQVTSVDVERSFSVSKHILSKRRHSSKEEIVLSQSEGFHEEGSHVGSEFSDVKFVH